MNPTEPKVKYINLGEMNPVDAASFAARVCRGKEDKEYTQEKSTALVRGCLKAGHLEVFQHLPISVKIKSGRECDFRLLLAAHRNIGALTVETWDGYWATNAAVVWEARHYLSCRVSDELKEIIPCPGALYETTYGHRVPPDHPMHLHSFLVDCSRVASHQLVRTKVLSAYCQQSQRAVRPSDVYLTGNPRIDLLSTVALDHMRAIDEPDEMSRYAAPESSMTRILVTRPTYVWREWIAKRGYHKTGKAQGEHEAIALEIESRLRQLGAI